MRSLVLLLVAVLAAAAAVQAADLPQLTTTVVSRGLGFPTAFAVAQDGTVYATSLAGNLVVRLDTNGTVTPLHQFTSMAALEGAGPAGITLDPDFDKNGFIYTFVGGENETTTGKVACSVYRFTTSPTGLTNRKTILRIKANPCGFEAGGKIAFGPDGKLYVGVGSMLADYPPNPALSQPSFFAKVQNWGSQVGKILRINKDGSFPRDNPKPNGVWAKGVRNTFGFAWDRQSPKPYNLWDAEPGPDCNDEINLVTRGSNLGWGPKHSCTSGTKPKNTNNNGAGVVLPKAMMQAPVGARPPTPTGLQICDRNCQLPPAYKNRLLVATFQPGTIVSWTLAGGKKRNQLKDRQLSLMHGPPITALERGKDGVFYFVDATGALVKINNA